jgi:hypothetical protein
MHTDSREAPVDVARDAGKQTFSFTFKGVVRNGVAYNVTGSGRAPARPS